MRCPKLRKSNSSMLVLFDDSISSISTSQIHHPLCQSILDPWMTTRCGFCPKNIRSFFPSCRQHYSDHFATSIVSQKEHMLLEKNKLNNHFPLSISAQSEMFRRWPDFSGFRDSVASPQWRNSAIASPFEGLVGHQHACHRRQYYVKFAATSIARSR